MPSTHWRQLYQQRLTPAAQALAKVQPGDRVFIGSACGEPRFLVQTMVAASANLADTEIIQVLTLGLAPYADPRYAPHFRANAFFIGTGMRDAVNQARADYSPVFLSRVPGLFRSRRVGIDAALIMVSPPDEQGLCSLGVSVDITKAAAETAGLVIAQVNRHMPRTGGEALIPVSELDLIVEHDEPLAEWTINHAITEVTRTIAYHIARLVPDGSTLQLGIGTIPDTVAQSLTDKHDLGIHSEMISDGVMKLMRSGNITGKRKVVNTGKVTASFAAGSRELFSFIDNNPQIDMQPSDYTNHPQVIGVHDHMVAINSALEVDLTGQVVADSLGTTFYSGIGGHADFMRGAVLARGGKAIIALPSVAHTQQGPKSRIVAFLQEGAGVTTTRGDPCYIVTEYGVACLNGRTMRERAMSLIGIAHPDFRSDLLHAAKRRHLVYMDQILPPPQRGPQPGAGGKPPAAHAGSDEAFVALGDGTEVHLRPIRPDDESQAKDMFYSFSRQTIYLRFHNVLKAMPHSRLQVFCNPDPDTEVALAAVTGDPGDEQVVGIGRYMIEPAGASAEMAFVVRDDYQRKGLGTRLFEQLLAIGKKRGLKRFTAEVLIENSGMLKIFHRSGLKVQTSTEGGVVHVIMDMPG